MEGVLAHGLVMGDTSSKKSRKRRFRPSKSLMRDMIAAALDAGVTDPVLEIRPDGTLTVRAADVQGIDIDEKRAEWEKALYGPSRGEK